MLDELGPLSTCGSVADDYSLVHCVKLPRLTEVHLSYRSHMFKQSHERLRRKLLVVSLKQKCQNHMFRCSEWRKFAKWQHFHFSAVRRLHGFTSDARRELCARRETGQCCHRVYGSVAEVQRTCRRNRTDMPLVNTLWWLYPLNSNTLSLLYRCSETILAEGSYCVVWPRVA